MCFWVEKWRTDRRGQCSHVCRLCIHAKVPYLSELYGSRVEATTDALHFPKIVSALKLKDIKILKDS